MKRTTEKASKIHARNKYLLYIGHKLGRLTVTSVEFDNTNKKNSKRWYFICDCECGNEAKVASYDVLHGTIKSCGCQRKELQAGARWTLTKANAGIKPRRTKRSTLPKCITPNAPGYTYKAIVTNANKAYYLGSDKDIRPLMRRVAKFKVEHGIWSAYEAEQYLNSF